VAQRVADLARRHAVSVQLFGIHQDGELRWSPADNPGLGTSRQPVEARVRAQEYLVERENLFGEGRFEVDVLISPERLVTDYVTKLIEYPGALQVLDFANGQVQLVATRSYFGGPLLGKSLAEIKQQMPKYQAQIAAIYRSNRSIPLTDDTVVEIGDEIFFVAATTHIMDVMSALRRLENPYKRIMIAGGGNIGFSLAQNLENDYQVKLFERNQDRARYIAQKLHKTIVLLGDASERELLANENVEFTDVFCAVTNDDEVNIMSCMQAKRMGAKHVMALITRTAYVDLIEGSDIDIAISPQQSTIGSILTHIRQGDIVNVHSLRRGAAEAIEVVAHGDKKTSRVVGRKLSQINLPKDTNIGAIVRQNKVVLPTADTEIESEDHIILFLIDKRHLAEVEQLFQVSVIFV
ncbi:MAG: Trk system potassium transporter TrkA, partial [Gammaproteobacteria bacterium]